MGKCFNNVTELKKLDYKKCAQISHNSINLL